MTTTLTCTKCSFELSFDHKFCPNCGQRVRTTTEGTSSARTGGLKIVPPDDGIETEPAEADEEKEQRIEEINEEEKKEDDEYVTPDELIRSRSLLLKNLTRRAMNLLIETPNSTLMMLLFVVISLCCWGTIVAVAVAYTSYFGFAERCGWEGGRVRCYVALWEKICRTTVPIVVPSISTAFFDCVVGKTFSVDLTKTLIRCVCRPAVVIGIIGFDGMHHLNRTFRYFSTALFIVSWALSECLLFADRFHATTGILRCARFLHDRQDRFLRPVLRLAEVVVLCNAAIGSPRRIFRYPIVDTSAHLWVEEEGIGSFPSSAITLARVIASAYAVWVGYSTTRDVAAFIHRRFLKKTKAVSAGTTRPSKQKKKKKKEKSS